MSGDEPLGASILVALAGLFVFLEGVVFGLVSAVASSLGAVEAGIALGGLAFVAILLGLLLAVIGFLLYRKPESHRGLGVAAIVLSLICLAVGGGFYLGTILGVVGGILGIVWEDPADALELPEWNSSAGFAGASVGSSGPWVAAPPATHCSNCGSPLSPGATMCTSCETPVRASFRSPPSVATNPSRPR